jgi:hypothetical protein
MTSRRSMVAGAALAVLPIPAIAAQQPDADLIRICAQHTVNRITLDKGEHHDTIEYNAVDYAYAATLQAVCDAKPLTVAGIVAKARAAKDEAQLLRGGEGPEGSIAAQWAWDIVNDLIRLAS